MRMFGLFATGLRSRRLISPMGLFGGVVHPSSIRFQMFWGSRQMRYEKHIGL